MKEEQSRNLQNTACYRDLQKQRVEVQRQVDAESAKLAAEAGKEEAENMQKMGELMLSLQREMAQLANSLRRITMQEQMEQDIEFARAENALKLGTMAQEVAALDKEAKDYENKLREIQNKEKQMEQQQADDVAEIQAKAQAKELTDQRTAMASMENTFASGFMQVLARHQSFASMMEHASQQLSSTSFKPRCSRTST